MLLLLYVGLALGAVGEPNKAGVPVSTEQGDHTMRKRAESNQPSCGVRRGQELPHRISKLRWALLMWYTAAPTGCLRGWSRRAFRFHGTPFRVSFSAGAALLQTPREAQNPLWLAVAAALAPPSRLRLISSLRAHGRGLETTRVGGGRLCERPPPLSGPAVDHKVRAREEQSAKQGASKDQGTGEQRPEAQLLQN